MAFVYLFVLTLSLWISLYAVTFHSKKRFKLGTTVYCSNSDIEPVKQSLNDLLPQVKSELDLLDKIARFLSL